MTTQTEDLIKAFSLNKDITLLPSIIIGMQEEDNVCKVLHFKNCFRQLRNLAAHEPYVITSQIMAGTNVNNTRLVFDSKDNTEVLTVNMEAFTAWMFDMYTITGNIAYLVFWRTLMKILYPSICSENTAGVTFKFGSDTTRLLSEFAALQDYMVANFGELWVINPKDAYIQKHLKENIKIFWRMAIPNFFTIIKLYLNGCIDVRHKDNINMFLALYSARE